MIVNQIKQELALWHELLDKKKTAAEKVVSAGIEALHQGLTLAEGKVVTVTHKTAVAVRAIAAEVKRDFTEAEQAALKEWDAAVAYTEKVEAALKEQQAKAQGSAPVLPVSAPPAAPVDTAAPAPVVNTAASVDTTPAAPGS